MADLLICKEELLSLVSFYAEKRRLSSEVTEDYYEPGMMEYLDKYRGIYDKEAKIISICCESKGLRYDNRTSNLEGMNVGDEVRIVRDHTNPFNSNNFEIKNGKNASLGYLAADLCNALGPLYDSGAAEILSSKVSYMEKLAERSRYAKQGVLFVEIMIQLRGI